MTEIRIHGRGGQGVVTAADLLAMAAFKEGHHAQAFPSFGSERTGAPVVSYCRISDSAIRTREPVLDPDIVVVLDPTLLSVMDVFSGFKDGGYAVVNSRKTLEELKIAGTVDQTILTVPASEIAREHVGRPLPNAAILGALAALTGQLGLPSVQEAILERFHGRIGKGNAAAAEAAYNAVMEQKELLSAHTN